MAIERHTLSNIKESCAHLGKIWRCTFAKILQLTMKDTVSAITVLSGAGMIRVNLVQTFFLDTVLGQVKCWKDWFYGQVFISSVYFPIVVTC